MVVYFSPHQRRRQRLRSRLKIYAVIVVTLGAAAGLWQGATALPLFKIQKITIEGGERVSNSAVMRDLILEIMRSPWTLVLGADHWLAWPSGSANSPHPLVANLTIVKNLRQRTIAVTVYERTSDGLWCLTTRERCWWFDREGTVLEAAPADGRHDFTLVSEEMPEEVRPGNRFLSTAAAVYLQKIKKGLQEQQLVLAGVEWRPTYHDLIITVRGGPIILASLRFDPTVNLAALAELGTRKNFSTLSTVDLRAENRIFFTLK